MPKELSLKKIKEEIKGGDLGKARDRLHGLIATYPEDLELRAQAAEIYHRLQFPAMAGRYWYLAENKTTTMTAACKEFEKFCGNDSGEILFKLKFYGDINTLPRFAKNKLLALREDCRIKDLSYPDFGPRKKIKCVNKNTCSCCGANPNATFFERHAGGIILSILLAIIIFIITGFFTIFGYPIYRIIENMRWGSWMLK